MPVAAAAGPHRPRSPRAPRVSPGPRSHGPSVRRRGSSPRPPTTPGCGQRIGDIGDAIESGVQRIVVQPHRAVGQIVIVDQDQLPTLHPDERAPGFLPGDVDLPRGGFAPASRCRCRRTRRRPVDARESPRHPGAAPPWRTVNRVKRPSASTSKSGAQAVQAGGLQPLPAPVGQVTAGGLSPARRAGRRRWRCRMRAPQNSRAARPGSAPGPHRPPVA